MKPNFKKHNINERIFSITYKITICTTYNVNTARIQGVKCYVFLSNGTTARLAHLPERTLSRLPAAHSCRLPASCILNAVLSSLLSLHAVQG